MDKALPILLRELRLPTINAHCEAYESKAVENAWGYSEYLSKLAELEVEQRYQTRIQNWTREAKLPTGKSFATLQLDNFPAAVQKQIIGLRDNNTWVQQAHNVLLIGPSGVGKSHVASALALHCIEQGIRAKWISATQLVQELQQAKVALELMTFMSRLDKYRVIVVDDIGYVKKDDAETQVLFEFIAHRYESGSLIVTSNQPFSHWDQIFPDALMTVAAIDRIIHHAEIIEIDVESYRKKNRKGK